MATHARKDLSGLRLRFSFGCLGGVAAFHSAIKILSGRSRDRGWRRAQNGGGFGAARHEHVVDQLSGASGSAQANGFEACLPWLDGISGAEDQLLAKLVYRGGARQHGRAGDPEVLQDALDGTGKALRMGCGVLAGPALARRSPRTRCRP